METGAQRATVHGLQRVRHDCVAISISIGIQVDDFSPIINLFPKFKKKALSDASKQSLSTYTITTQG